MALQTPQGDFFIQNLFNGNVLQKEPQTNVVVLKPKLDYEEWRQVWYRDGNFLKCKFSNQALTMNPGMACTGAKLYVSPCHWSPYQKWVTKNRSRIANHMEQCTFDDIYLSGFNCVNCYLAAKLSLF